MPPALQSREDVIDTLMLVVRRRGYDGASLAELSKATGLGKSSLYHYFPDGKDDMVRSVLDRLEGQMRESVFGPLMARGAPRARLDAMVKTLDAFYRGGREACVLGTLVLGSARGRFQKRINGLFDDWITAIARPLEDAKMSRSVARARAEDAVTRIEGALVLAGARDDGDVFRRMLRQLPADLLAPVKHARR
ncbi:MAG: TetR/AcrR family transcriptional regulator [bacterium]